MTEQKEKQKTKLHSHRAPASTLVPGRSGPLVHSSDRRQGPRRRGSDADPVIVISSGDDNDDVLCRYFYSCAKYFSIISRVRTRLLQQGYFLRKKAVAAPPRPLGTVSFCWFWPDIDLLSQLLGYHLFIRTLHEPS